MRCLMWFRADLRVEDNVALYQASRAATRGLVGIYVFAKRELRLHDVAACRVEFILRNLAALSEKLRVLNVPLLVIQTESFKEVPALLLNLMRQHEMDALYFNEQYEIDEARRDTAVERLLRAQQLKVFSYTDQVILAPGEVLTQSGAYYTVFTPFKKAWFLRVRAKSIKLMPAPVKQAPLPIKGDDVPVVIENRVSSIPAALWPAGEAAAQQRLVLFIKNKIQFYAKERDFPALAGTSQLSAYLTSGILSPRQCLQAALEANNQLLETGEQGIVTWINELIWREFYKHILHGFPRVSMHRAFKLETENIPWDNNKKLFAAWCEGRTGYPLIDAAMRQMLKIGWMHNRLRMLTAMFLVKDLLIDWRLGEKFFMQHLIDGDLSANNGGWQWSASTGTDAAPYFRIFNPFTQSQRFDPQGEFIRQYCPELAHLDNKMIHTPHLLPEKQRKALPYPEPIVDHNKARQRAISLFKQLTPKLA